MAAPKGNKFWQLRSKHGCDKLFATPELMWEAACEYFEWCEKNPIPDPRSFGQRKIQRPYTIQGLTRYLHCNTVYFAQFKLRIKEKEDQDSKDFAKVIQDIEDAIYQQKYENSVIGVFKENIISRDLGLADKAQLTGEGGGPIKQEVAVTLNL
ncbi:MAG: terminase small subunit [Pseudobacter sp.]|uniref:terminase small subunit n=1 Tax=Pseudobacter sp. TaxID=2045420 RepID=UPI003F7D8969